ncbi:MAG: hypothetical protein GEU99_00225 [Luteitalea sp.]|nr:hypothetical protein [Luteitalea sp.]
MSRVLWPGFVAIMALVVAPVSALAQTPDTEPEAEPRTSASESVAATSRPLLTTTPVPKNPQLVARLQALLPRDMSVEQAAHGFDDQEDFVAAVHVSRNLSVPFSDLKTRMVTGKLSLGEAIHAVDPDADVKREEKRARRQAAADLEW